MTTQERESPSESPSEADRIAEAKAAAKKHRRIGHARPHAGNKLQQLRRERNLTLQLVADAIGLHVSTTQAIEAGQEVKLTWAKRLAKFYGKRVEDIWPDV